MVSARSAPIMPHLGRRRSQCPPAWRQLPGPGGGILVAPGA